MAGETTHVQLVDNQLFCGPVQGLVALPVVGLVHHDAADRRVVVGTGLFGTPTIPALVAHRPRPGIDQRLLRVEAESGLRGVVTRAIDTPVVARPRHQAFHIDVPGEKGAVHLRIEPDHLERLAAGDAVEQQQFNLRSVAAEHRKIHASGVGPGTERIAGTGLARIGVQWIGLDVCVITAWARLSRCCRSSRGSNGQRKICRCAPH